MPQEVLCTLMYMCLFAGGRPPRKLGCDWWQSNAFEPSTTDSHGLGRRSYTNV